MFHVCVCMYVCTGAQANAKPKHCGIKVTRAERSCWTGKRWRSLFALLPCVRQKVLSEARSAMTLRVCTSWNLIRFRKWRLFLFIFFLPLFHPWQYCSRNETCVLFFYQQMALLLKLVHHRAPDENRKQPLCSLKSPITKILFGIYSGENWFDWYIYMGPVVVTTLSYLLFLYVSAFGLCQLAQKISNYLKLKLFSRNNFEL